MPIRINRSSKQYITTSPPHFLLHTTSESRALYLDYYTNLKLSQNYGSTIYIDLSIDTIFFDTLDCSPAGDLALDLAHSTSRNKIQRVAISVDLWEVLRVFRWDALSEVKCLASLKTLSLVLLRDQRRQDASGEWVDAGDGGETRVVRIHADREGSVEAEIRHSLWYVECLRGELERSVREEGSWCADSTPNVQLWLW